MIKKKCKEVGRCSFRQFMWSPAKKKTVQVCNYGKDCVMAEFSENKAKAKLV